MMHCPHCDKEIGDGLNFCPHCGTKIQQAPESERMEEKDEFFNAPPVQTAPEQTTPVRLMRVNLLAMFGFALSVLGLVYGAATWIGLIFTILTSAAGLVCSCLGLVRCKRNGANGKGFAIAGIVLSAVGIVLNIAMMIVTILYPNFWEDLINNLFGAYLNGGGY